MGSPQIKTGSAISYGWTSVKKDFWYFVGLAVVSTIIGSIGSDNNNANQWDLLGLLLSAWMTCGYMTMMLSYQAGHKLPFGDLFKQVKHYWEVLGATFLLFVIIVIGLILLIVPGVYLAVRFQFTIQLILDQGLGIMAAMKESTRLTNGIKMSLLGFDLTLLGVILLGAIVLGVGVFVALPVVWLASVVVYRQVSSASPVSAPSPAKA